MPDFYSAALTILFCLALVLAALLIVSRNLSFFVHRRAPLVIVIMILGVSVYSVGYLSSPENGFGAAGCLSAGLQALFSTGRMFVLENDIGELGSAASSPVFRLCFGAVMTAAMLTVLVVSLSFFGYRFICAFKLQLLRIFGSRRDVNVFSELSESSLMLAYDISRESKKAVFIFWVSGAAEPDEKSLEKQAAAENYLLIPCPLKPEKLSQLGVGRNMKGKIRIFAIGGRDAENARLAVSLSPIICGQARARSSLYVFLSTERYGELFYRPEFNGLEVVAVDKPELSARFLMDRLPPIKSARVRPDGSGCLPGTLTAAVIGYNEISPHLLRHIATQGQFAGLSLRLIVTDEGVSDKAASFFNRNAQFDRCAKTELIDVAPCSEGFFRYFSEHLHETDYIVCACGSDKLTAAAGSGLYRMSRLAGLSVKICACLHDGDDAQLLFSPDEYQNITVFGGEKELCTASLVIHEELDRMARAVHEYYRETSGDDRDWSGLTHYEKQSCRALALHIPAKLYSVGLRLTENMDARAYEKLIGERPDILENLSKGEHLRWNAHLFTDGWTQLPFGGAYEKKDLKLRRHPCLTDWDGLKKVSDAAGQDFQQYDVHLIRHLGDIARSAGYGIELIGEETP